jgi:predicted Zn finger-like uncharacterized protein
MLIVCPQCATSYKVEQAALGATGRTVRCVRCRNVWFTPAVTPVLEAVAVGAHAEPPQAVITPSVAAPVTEYVTAEPPPAPADIAEATVETQAVDEAAIAPADTDTASQPTAPEIEEPRTDPANETTEPTLVAEAPSIVPPIDQEPLPEQPAETVSDDVESFAARRVRMRQKRRKAGWHLPGLPATLLALVALVAILLGWRTQVVRFLPQTASFYELMGLPVNLRGLDFDSIKTTREMHEGIPVLVVEGNIATTTGRLAEVPRLRFAVRNEAGKEIYSWTAMPSRTLLGPGETLPFRSRLASPPAESHDVSVRFFTRRDALAGAR